jgi:hypothetical protein
MPRTRKAVPVPVTPPQPDMYARIDSAAETIAQAWIKDAFRTMGTVDFYLWWRPANEAERAKGLFALPIHSADQPADGYTRDILLSCGWDRFKAAREIAKRISTLPLF